MRTACSAPLLIAALFGAATSASAETVYGLTNSSSIVTFSSTAPNTVTSNRSISGLGAGVTLTGIDFRPADGQLYAVSSGGNLYRLAVSGGSYVASDLGALSTAPNGSSFGLDFNPTVDRLRFTSDANQNLRINQTVSPPGTIVDGAITLNGGSDIDLVGSAYTNNLAGATTTTLYGLDAFTDALVRSTDANAGTYTNTSLEGALFGPLGVTFSASDLVGFDISGPSGGAYFSLNDGFYNVNLTSGAATRVGTLGIGGLVGISVAPVPEPGTWAMMLIGFGAIGFAMRRQRQAGQALARA